MSKAGGARGALALGPFLDELEERLGALGAEAVRDALLRHGGRLPARERRAFLEIFASSAEPRARGPVTAPEPSPGASEALLEDIEAFLGRLESGAYVEAWGWDDDLHDERSFGDESWADEMDELFDGAEAAFLEGNLALARAAYGPLLKSFERNAEGFCGPEQPEQMLATDIGEAKARYLRVVYETSPLPERPDALFEELAALRYMGGKTALRQVMDARRAPLADLEAFLPAWDATLAHGAAGDLAPGLLPGDTTRLRSEAAQLRGGADALAELARKPGPYSAELHRDWVDALIKEGRGKDAAAAAREAPGRLGRDGSLRACIAERLAYLAAAEGDDDAVLQARREAWRSAPSTRRLLDLVDTATALGIADRLVVEEADWAVRAPRGDGRKGGPVANERLACELLLLAGRNERAVELLSAAPALGWHAHDHPAPVVVPFLLAAATGMAGPPGPEESLLARAFDQIDNYGWVVADDYVASPLDDERSQIAPRYRAIDGDQLVPSCLLAGRLQRDRSSAPERARWLSAARGAVEQRVAAVVGAQHRCAYERVAAIAVAVAVACAEALALTEHDDAGIAWLDARRSPRRLPAPLRLPLRA